MEGRRDGGVYQKRCIIAVECKLPRLSSLPRSLRFGKPQVVSQWGSPVPACGWQQDRELTHPSERAFERSRGQ